jgi:hypothetical protein
MKCPICNVPFVRDARNRTTCGKDRCRQALRRLKKKVEADEGRKELTEALLNLGADRQLEAVTVNQTERTPWEVWMPEAEPTTRPDPNRHLSGDDAYMIDPRQDPWHAKRLRKNRAGSGISHKPGLAMMMKADAYGQILGCKKQEPRHRPFCVRDTRSFSTEVRTSWMICEDCGMRHDRRRACPPGARALLEAIRRAHTAAKQGSDREAIERRGRLLSELRASLNGTYEATIESHFPFSVSEAEEYIAEGMAT